MATLFTEDVRQEQEQKAQARRPARGLARRVVGAVGLWAFDILVLVVGLVLAVTMIPCDIGRAFININERNRRINALLKARKEGKDG